MLFMFTFFSRENEHYLLSYYLKPHTRYGPFLIGILTGIYLKRRKGPLVKQKVGTIRSYSKHCVEIFVTTAAMLLLRSLSQWQAVLGWLLCFSLMAALVQLAYVLKETPAYPSVPHALYQGLHRCLWVLAVTWIILACEDGYGGTMCTLTETESGIIDSTESRLHSLPLFCLFGGVICRFYPNPHDTGYLGSSVQH